MDTRLLVDFMQDEQAATSIEYALLASLIGIFVLVSVKLAGESLSTLYSDSASKIVGAIGS